MNIEELKQGQAVWVKGIITDIEEDEILDLEIHTSENNFCVNSSDVYASVYQPKPAVPQFVADLIEKYKEKRCRLSHALEHVFDDVELSLYIKQQEGDYTEIIAKAWIYGYTVQKEKLYTVEIPNPHAKGHNKIYLCKDGNTGKVYLCKGNFNPKKNKNLRLTEQEIRKDFDWAWQWAEEVTE